MATDVSVSRALVSQLADAASFDAEVLQSSIPVLIDVSAKWCPPCKAAAPFVTELAQRHAGRLKVVMIDGDNAPELVARLGVRGYPTFLGVRHGEIVARSAGFGGKRALELLVEQQLLAESEALAAARSS